MEEDEYNTNNFIMYFPGGTRRQASYLENPKVRKIISDLDRILEELCFDLKLFQDEREKYTELFRKSIDTLRDGGNASEELGKECDEHYNKLHEMARPVLNKMVEDLGYVEGELTK